jgi:hypothetical protein
MSEQFVGGGPLPASAKTRVRVIGPKVVNGMNVWEVWDLHRGKMIGPPCMTMETTKQRVRDFLEGKLPSFWFGPGNLAFRPWSSEEG